VADLDSERSYRIFVQQLPVPASAQPGGVRMQTLLRLGIPVFVPAKAPRVGVDWRVVKSHGGRIASLEATNTGNMHVQLTRVVVREPAGRALVDAPMSTYLLGGQRLVLPIAVPLDDVSSGAMLTIEQSSDAVVPLPSVLSPLRADPAR
jgi:fimbrial chaperone protein